MKYVTTSIILILVISGTILYKSYNFDSVYFKNNKEHIDDVTEKPLPSNDFHYPIYSTSTKIVNAEIETIDFKYDVNTFEAQIFKKIDGVSDDKIIDINNELTNGIFKNGLSDIRNKKNRELSTDISIDGFRSSIMYADKGIIQYYLAYEIGVENAAHPARNPGDIFTIYLEGNNNHLFKKDMGSKVLEHFYPNGKKILATKITEADRGDDSCYKVTDFPNSFEPSFNVITREVVFKVYFPYSQIGPCQGEVEIGIPLDSVLKEVPQYIADDSLLLKFK